MPENIPPQRALRVIGHTAMASLLHALPDAELARPVTVTIREEGWQLVLTLLPDDGPARLVLAPNLPPEFAGLSGQPAAQEPDTSMLTDKERDIFEASTATPVARKALLRRAGYKADSDGYKAIRHLLELGILSHGPCLRVRRASV